MKPKVSSRKGIKIRVEINETENKITRMNKTKSWFFEKIKLISLYLETHQEGKKKKKRTEEIKEEIL